MGWTLIKECHICSKPRVEDHEVGTVIQCDCKAYHRLQNMGGKKFWTRMSIVEVAFSGLNNRPAQGGEPRGDEQGGVSEEVLQGPDGS